jgi:hypothetical protein
VAGEEMLTGFGKGFCTVVWHSDKLTPNLRPKIGAEKVNRAIDTVFNYMAPQIEGAAKVNAPWTDQTGNARNGLRSLAGREGDTHFIALFHSVDYGLWLEVRWSGQYATVMPTLEEYSPKVMAELNGLLGKDIFK